MTVGEAGGRLGAAEIADLRRWARTLAGNGGSDVLRDAGATILRLADEAERLRAEADGGWGWSEPASAEERPAPQELASARRLAAETLANGAAPELKAAGRGILLLCEEIAALRGEEAEVPPPAAPYAPGAEGLRLPRPSLRLLLLVGVPAVAVAGLLLAGTLSAPELDARGSPGGGLVGARALPQLRFSVAAEAGNARWTLDGEDVTDRAAAANGRLVLRPGALPDGRHVLEVTVGSRLPFADASHRWTFVVDTRPPAIELPATVLEAPARTELALEGSLEAGAQLTANGKPVPVRDGRFVLRYPEPPERPIVLRARDAAGNVGATSVTVLATPRRPAAPIKAVHVTAQAWANEGLRSAVLRLIDEGRINAVELDLKDESGVIGWDAPVELGRMIGAVQPVFDLAAAVETLHAKGVRVVGRLVAFRDPLHADWAWRNRQRRQVVQAPGGGPYAGYGGFTNFADSAVREYNIAVAVAAAELGVDDILYDYVRRPDGPLDTMAFPGLEGEIDDAIVGFLAESREALRPHGTFVGASVFGIAATRPEEVAQPIPEMAREIDYIAPMLYPSHWAAGEYGVASPNAQPYDIVRRSLEDFQRAVAGTGARVVPWLQDFSLGVEYGPAEVRAQIQAARDAGLREFLLWDPEVTYTAAALATNARLPSTGTAPAEVRPSRFATLEPNELGVVPVLMYHQLLPDGGGEYDLTADEFRAELERLYLEEYRPIRASDYVRGEIDVPEGTTPVVITFDDGTANQAALLPGGTLDPDTAVGIMLEFARTHPDFEPAGTFYVNRSPFAAEERTAELVRALVAAGFELGNHTRDHLGLGGLPAAEVQEQIVLGNRVVHELLPDAEVVTMALPLGSMPDDPGLALAGSSGGEAYRFEGVMLVGAEPAPSPYARSFDAGGIPRIRTFPSVALANGSADWLGRLAQTPELRFVSDGDPGRVTVPAGRRDEVADRYADRAAAG